MSSDSGPGPRDASGNDDTSNGNGNGGDSPGWLRSLRAKLGLSGSPSLRDTLEMALKQGSQSAEAFSSQEREMLLRILRFGGLKVFDVMVPRADIVGVDERASMGDLVRLFEEAGHSRVPIFRESLDDLRGMIHIKDVMSWLADRIAPPGTGNDANEDIDLHAPAIPSGTPVAAVVSAPGQAASPTQASPVAEGATARPVEQAAEPPRPGGLLDMEKFAADLARPISSTRLRREVLFVPPSMPVVNLLLRMQSTRIHLAMVVDEYGGTDGLVSIEDLVEEIVGDIEDEHDDDEAELIAEVPRLGLVASARAPIDEVEEFLGLSLLEEDEEEDIDTLGGLVFSMAGRVPVRGELIRHPSGVEFEVLDADPRRIRRIRIHRRSGAPGAPVAEPKPA
ncbi:MAG: CBS domain-containing protein [Rhizobiales bacterium]|nr:CBS domain-containing protein [Hyphomicrobiales bacterium]